MAGLTRSALLGLGAAASLKLGTSTAANKQSAAIMAAARFMAFELSKRA